MYDRDLGNVKYYATVAVADPAIGVGGGTPRHLPKIWCPLERTFKKYMNHCHRDPGNIFFNKHA